ncbi:MAG: bacteriohemerythrin, partial [Magnetococcales bacterium]|nr:bacteriohemerythrin [Magnetococcales bacterium]
PYFTMREYFYVKQFNSRLMTAGNLSEARIAVVKGYGTIPKLKEAFPKATIIETRDLMASFNAVLNGEVDALLEAQVAVEQLIRENAIGGLRAIGQELFPASPLHLFSRIDEPLLQSILQKGLDSISEEERNEIRSRWLNLENQGNQTDGEQIQSLDIPLYVVWIITGSLVTVLLMWLLIRILMRRIDDETLARQFGSNHFRLFMAVGSITLAATVLALTWAAIEYNKRQDIAGIQENLEGVLESATERLTSWSAAHKGDLERIGRDRRLAIISQRLLDLHARGESVKGSLPLQQAREFFSSLEAVGGEIGFFIISPDGVSLGSRRDANVDTTNFLMVKRPGLIKRVLAGESVFIPPLRSDVSLAGAGPGDASTQTPATMFFAAPILDKDNRIIAVVTRRISPNQDFSRILQSSRLGRSGESYAFNKKGVLLSASRFDDDLYRFGLIEKGQTGLLNLEIRDPGANLSLEEIPPLPLSQRPLTRMAASAVKGVSDVDMEGYSDYRGIEVMGAWLWSDSLGLALATEIDMDEAMGPFYTMRWTVFGIIGFTLILSVGAILFTLIVGERATLALSRARNELEDRVEERTRELRHSELRMRTIIENAVDGIIVIDINGVVQSFSPAAERIFGYAAMEVIGNNVNMLMDEPYHSQHDAYLKHYLDTGESRILGKGRELVGRHKNGSHFPMDLAVGEAIYEEETMFTGIIRDITARKEAETRLTDALDVISSSIQYASRIQRSILPPVDTVETLIPDSFVLWEPRDVVGGDMYWCRQWGDGFLVVLGDCTGHGVPGAFMTLIANGALNQAVRDIECGNPAALIGRMHSLIQRVLGQDKPGGESDDGLELGACFIDAERTSMVFAGARFPLLLLDKGKSDVIEQRGDRKGIGYRGIPQDYAFTNHTIEIKPGRRFYMTSDGLLDQVGGEKRRGYGKRRLKALLVGHADEPLAKQGLMLSETLVAWQDGETRRDDVSVIGFSLDQIHMPNWIDDLMLGHAAMDEDHKRLLNLVNDLGLVSQSPQARTLLRGILKALVQYTHVHFQREESLMIKYDYPDYEQHRQAHARLITHVADYGERLENQDDYKALAEEMIDMLKRWLVHHIMTVDRKLAQFLAQHKTGPYG